MARMNLLQKELQSIHHETNPEYSRLLDIISNERNESIQGAQVFKIYQLEISRKLYEEELESVVNDINHEKETLRDKMLIGLEEKRRRLEFELNSGAFNSFDFNGILILLNLDQQNANYRLPNRKGRGSSISNVKVVEAEKVLGRKRKNQNVAILNVGLKEHEIYDDISYFRRMGISGRRGVSRK